MNSLDDLCNHAISLGHSGRRSIHQYLASIGKPVGKNKIERWLRDLREKNGVRKKELSIQEKIDREIQGLEFTIKGAKFYETAISDGNGGFTIANQKSVHVVRKELELSDIVNAVKAVNVEPIQIPIAKYRTGDLLIVNPSDAHIDKVNIDGLDGYQVWMKYMDDCLADAALRKPSKILFIVGNDFFNSEFHTNATTAGTPQETNRSPDKSFELAVSGWVNWTKRFSMVAPVEIFIVPGNHDRNTCKYLGVVLKAMMPSVKVNNEYISTHEHGRAFLAFTHGDRGEAKSPEKACLALSQDPYTAMQVGKTNKYLFLGHLHAQQVKSVNGWCIRTLSGLSGMDAWHQSMYYNSRACGEWGYITMDGLYFAHPWQYV